MSEPPIESIFLKDTDINSEINKRLDKSYYVRGSVGIRDKATPLETQ
jgi:hypothetical protein